MGDILKYLQAYLDGDPVAIMSKARVSEAIAEIKRLRKCEKDHMKDIEKMQKDFRKAWKEEDERLNKLVEECPYEMKLAITRWVMKHIADHVKQPGSYRYLIYDRMGFGPDAYRPLLDDGMFISNEISDMKYGIDGE